MYSYQSKLSRPRMLAILTIVTMAVFIVRLFYLQIIQHSYYVAQANSEQLKQLVIPAKRGEIYAMDNGTPVKLVLNEAVYTVFADPKVVKDSGKVISVVNRVAGGNARPHLDQLFSIFMELDSKKERSVSTLKGHWLLRR
jgi:cell division protein FtsI/penicillin-binding protein 2